MKLWKNMSKVPARVKHMHPRGKELLCAECLNSSRNLPSKFSWTKTPLSSHSFLRSIMMLCKKGKPFRSGINAGLLGDRETLATKSVCTAHRANMGTQAHAGISWTWTASLKRLLGLIDHWRHKTLGQWLQHTDKYHRLISLWFSKPTYNKKIGKEWKT